jgi:hypothetical protein
MNTPIEIAKALYEEHCDEPFEAALTRYFTSPSGAVVMGPTQFAMGCAIDFDGKYAWFIDTAVGRLQDLVKLFPFPLPYIAFCRRVKGDKLKIYKTERFLRHVK